MSDKGLRIRYSLSAGIVFAIAVVVRVPSCYESFWVDELHSTWTIWSDWKDIVPRSKIGNQTPFYFVGLYVWKQWFGESEMALRMTSVLATAIAASLLTIGVAKWTRSVVGGVAAGLVLATESNAIFFGTELRPYAPVILASTIAVLCWLRLMTREPDDTSHLPWIGFVSISLFAALLQPTSLGVLGWLFVSLAVDKLVRRRIRLRFNLVNALLLTAALAVGWALWHNTLASTWRFRSNWETFARAPSWTDAASLWSWGWLWLIPLVLLFMPCGHWLTTEYSKRQRTTIASLAGVCLIASVCYWFASRMDWVHLWHRRYAVALLPLFAALVGSAVGRFQISNFKFQIPAYGVAAVLLVGLTYSQGVLPMAIKNPSHLAYRGEDWRAAIQWVNQNATSSDRMFLDSGLIEADLWGTHMYPPGYRPSNLREQYLMLPISGPYESLPFYPIDRSVRSLASNIYVDAQFRRERAIHFQAKPSQRRRMIYLSRRPAGKQDLKFIKAIGSQYIDADSIAVHGFGGVSIVVIPLVDET